MSTPPEDGTDDAATTPGYVSDLSFMNQPGSSDAALSEPSLPTTAPTDTPDPSPINTALGAAGTDPIEQFRAVLDAAITAIEPFAVMGEGNRTGGAMPTGLLGELQASGQGRAVSAATERSEFTGLASVMNDFSSAIGSIRFADHARGAADDLRRASDALGSVAHAHSLPSDQTSPSIDRRASKEFLKAVNQWEGATAKLAGKLDI